MRISEKNIRQIVKNQGSRDQNQSKSLIPVTDGSTRESEVITSEYHKSQAKYFTVPCSYQLTGSQMEGQACML